MDLLSYIQYIKMETENLNGKSVHIVLGNDSCDLDSTISSIVFAYYLFNYHYNRSVLVIPVLNIKNEEFLLRSENCFLLKKIGVDIEQLLYRDALDLENIVKCNEVKITLIDHHVLSPEDNFLQPFVIQIIDHRPIDKNISWNESKVDITIKEVASCATLIADKLLNKIDILKNKNCIYLLYETIIFDSIGFSVAADKAKQLDLEIISKLEEILSFTPNSRKESFEELWSIHNDISSFTPEQLLLKDLKKVNDIFIPGLPMLVEKFLNIENSLEVLRKFCEKRKCPLLLLMGLETTDGVQRDLAFYFAQSTACINKFIAYFESLEEFQFKKENCDNQLVYFKQGNVKLSRKQIIPIVKEFFNLNKLI